MAALSRESSTGGARTHPPEFNHALKEVDVAANAVARSPQEVARALRYVIAGKL